MSQHKCPDCDGKWIDISTLHRPRMEMCIVCRATRPAMPEGYEEPEPLPPTELVEEPRSAASPYTRYLGWSIAFLCGLALGAALG